MMNVLTSAIWRLREIIFEAGVWIVVLDRVDLHATSDDPHYVVVTDPKHDHRQNVNEDKLGHGPESHQLRRYPIRLDDTLTVDDLRCRQVDRKSLNDSKYEGPDGYVLGHPGAVVVPVEHGVNDHQIPLDGDDHQVPSGYVHGGPQQRLSVAQEYAEGEPSRVVLLVDDSGQLHGVRQCQEYAREEVYGDLDEKELAVFSGGAFGSDDREQCGSVGE